MPAPIKSWKGCRFCISKEIALVNVVLTGWKCHHSVTLNLILSKRRPWWQLSKYYRSNWLLAHFGHYQAKLISILQNAFLLFDNNFEITSWQPDHIVVAAVARLYLVFCTSIPFSKSCICCWKELVPLTFLTFFIDCDHIYVPKGNIWGSPSRPHIG